MKKEKLKTGAKLSYALGAVGKDMVYMLSASYVLYYYQDILGVSVQRPDNGHCSCKNENALGQIPPVADDRHCH